MELILWKVTVEHEGVVRKFVLPAEHDRELDLFDSLRKLPPLDDLHKEEPVDMKIVSDSEKRRITFEGYPRTRVTLQAVGPHLELHDPKGL